MTPQGQPEDSIPFFTLQGAFSVSPPAGAFFVYKGSPGGNPSKTVKNRIKPELGIILIMFRVKKENPASVDFSTLTGLHESGAPEAIRTPDARFRKPN